VFHMALLGGYRVFFMANKRLINGSLAINKGIYSLGSPVLSP
jgi:hypothetical protein